MKGTYSIHNSYNQPGWTVRNIATFEEALAHLAKMPTSNYSVKFQFGDDFNSEKSVFLCRVTNGVVHERADVYGRFCGYMPDGYEHPPLLREEYFD